MILFLLLIDIIINNNTVFITYFFLSELPFSSIKYYIFIGLFLDFIIYNTFFENTIILLFLYFINKFLNKNYSKNIYGYLLVVTINLFYFLVINNLINFNYPFKQISLINLFINYYFYYMYYFSSLNKNNKHII